MVVAGHRIVGVIRDELLVDLALEFSQGGHTGAADTDGHRRRAGVLLGLFAGGDNAAAIVEQQGFIRHNIQPSLS